MLQIVAQLPTYCGDGQVQAPNSAGQTEECDGSDLADQSCQSLGFPNGTLTCSSHCNLDKNMCTGAPLLPPPVFTQGIKISLTDVLPENDVFATEIKANETFTNEVTIYTTLYDDDGKVLALKLEKVTGLAEDQTYIATLNYPETDVEKKSVIIYDVKQNPTIFGNIEVEIS